MRCQRQKNAAYCRFCLYGSHKISQSIVISNSNSYVFMQFRNSNFKQFPHVRIVPAIDRINVNFEVLTTHIVALLPRIQICTPLPRKLFPHATANSCKPEKLNKESQLGASDNGKLGKLSKTLKSTFSKPNTETCKQA